MTTPQAPASSYWVDLIATEVRIIQGKYRSRILEAGKPGAPALILLHGTGGHLENYARNIAPLAEHFHVVAMDFLWHGRSQTEGYDPEVIPALVDQVADVMDVLDIPRAHLAGQSMGGWVAMQFALRHPQRVGRLVLTTTMGYAPDAGAIPGYVEPDWAANLPSSLEVLRNPSFDNVKTRMARILANPAQVLTDEAVRVRQALYRQPALAAVQAGFITEYLAGSTIRRHTVTDALARHIGAPTLVYWGDQNRSPPSLGQHIARQLQHGRFHCAANTGHWAQFESADEYNAVVTAFLLEDAAPPSQGAHTMSITDQFIGRWNLVAWEQRYDDGRLHEPMGEHPRGFIRYSADGEMVVMISREGRQRFEKGGQWDAPDDEKAGAYNSMLSYAGRFSVDGDTVTHHVDMSLFPNWEGGTQKRKFALKPDGTLELTGRMEEGSPEARTAALVWRRACPLWRHPMSNPEIGQSIQCGPFLTNYHDIGAGEAVLMLHGSGPGVSAWANWRLTQARLKSGFRLLLPDLAGFGYTPAPAGEPLNREAWLGQIVAFLDALGIERCHVIGNSFGGSMALALAIEHPERVNKLVLMGSVGVPFELTAGLDAVWGYAPSFENMQAIMKIFAYDQALIGDALVQMRFEASARPGMQEAFSRMFPAPRQRWVDAMAHPEEKIRAIRHPTLLVHGRDDQVIPLSTSLTLLDWIEDSQLHIFGKCGHWTQIEHDAEFCRITADFLQGIPAA